MPESIRPEVMAAAERADDTKAPSGAGARPRKVPVCKRRTKKHGRVAAHINRIELHNPRASAPVKLRTPRTDKLHAQALDRDQRAKKYQRLRSLSRRAAGEARAFTALAARELASERMRAALQALRTSSNQASLAAVLVRRRVEYVRIPKDPASIAAEHTPQTARRQAVTTSAVQAVCAAVLVVLVVPVLVAVLAQFGTAHRLIAASRAPASVPARRARLAIVHGLRKATKHRSPAHPVIALAPARLMMAAPALVTLQKPQPAHVMPARTAAPSVFTTVFSEAIASSERTIRQALAAPLNRSLAFGVSAQPRGPHVVSIGWTALPAASQVSGFKIYRSTGEGESNQLIASVPASERSFKDVSVEAGGRYRYVVAADGLDANVHASTDIVETPADLPSVDTSALAGKGMFLYFSALLGDPHSYTKYEPDAVIAEAQKAGIRVIELRMARGTSFMAETSASRAWLDSLIDAAHAADIKLVAWTVPRRVSADDIGQAVASAAYTTPAGNGFIGLALDLEKGPRYMGDGPGAKERMVSYIRAVRSAVGSRYLLIATVASPMMGHLTNADYPYAGIAQYADVMQPMEYWHYFYEGSHHEYAHGEVADAAAATVLRTRELAGRDIPVNIAGQSVDLEGTGVPSAREITWSLGAAKSVGALGETFFDWAGTRPEGWAAIQAFDW